MGAWLRSIRVGMRTIRSTPRLSLWCNALHRQGVSVGLVPTMGALHPGHRSLIRAARLSCDAVVVSLFVNPRQFGRGEDLSRYPRRFQADAALCRREGVDVLFAPTGEAIYPTDFRTSVTVPEFSRRWEGKARPTHFEGVATIVTKLISLVRPAYAYFGQKDFQQALLVKRVVADLHLGARVIVCPTVRDRDGLAVSSRNEYLSPRQRRAAPILYAALQAGEKAVRSGRSRGAHIRRHMLRVIHTQPLARVEYLAVCDPTTLEPVTRVPDQVLLLGAIRIGRVRLIDNLLVRPPRRRRYPP